MKITDIDIQYRIPLQGEYNPSIFTCPACRPSDLSGLGVKLRNEDIVGFSEGFDGEAVAIYECPVCFEKSFYHVAEHTYADVLKKGRK